MTRATVSGKVGASPARRSPVKTTQRTRTDYKTPLTSRRARRNPHSRLRWTALGIGCAVLGVVMAKSQPAAEPDTSGSLVPHPTVMQQVSLELPAPASHQHPVATGEERDIARWQTLAVRSGDTLARLFHRAGIKAAVVHELTLAGDIGRRLHRIHPGDTIEVGFDPDGNVTRVRYPLDPERKAVFERTGGGFDGRVIERPLERRLEYASGTIESSLFHAGARAGMNDNLIMELVGIFAWDIDFALDIRRGDRFSVVYESLYKNGEHVRNGDIIAAEFINQGRSYRAVRYTSREGRTDYYAPDGSSMRKAFLRTPVKFSRISSGFGKRRHPVLGTMRNHHGVDYAAPPGTPVRATGDGRIVRRGRHGGYGNTVEIRHGGRYSTLYAHMRHFARGQHVGSHVEQGEVIGYVGSTGMSTGPHLHYEFRVNGRHRDPLKVEFPSSDPVPEERLDHFRRQIRPLLAQLDTLGRFHARLDR